MRADLQERISPTTLKAGSSEFSDVKPASLNGDVKDSTGPEEKIDFGAVLGQSNDETKKKREAKKRGDFSAFKTDDEFKKELSQATDQKRAPKNTLDKDDFLKLFVEQLKHQDPMNPDDGAEMASKLAQFNSLEQMLNVNTTLNKMVDGQKSERSMQMVNYIGKEVGLEGGRMRVENGTHTSASFDMKAPAEKTNVQVRDANGMTVREMDLGQMLPGTHELVWDGLDKNGAKAPDGVYSFFVEGKSKEGQDIPTTIKSRAKIMGVDTKGDKAAVYTDFGKVSYDDITSVGVNGYQDPKDAKPAGPKPQMRDDQQGAAPEKKDPEPSAKPAAAAVNTNEELEKMRANGQMQLPPVGQPGTGAGA